MFGSNAWRIGRIGGIELRIHPSWSFIAFLVAYTFYVILADAFPGRSTGALVAVAVVMAFVFFASVLIHELAHSWMATGRGVEVRGITLFLFGGATHADLETEDPTDELVISAVGPLTSLAIAAVLWVVSLFGGDGLLGFAAGRLGWINLALAIFNLIPGFPLDGGRILRSIVWERTGDLVTATRTAALAGRAVGYGLIALGVLQILFVGALVGGLWLVAIGWFLSQSAEASFLQLQVRRLLADVPASQLMTRDLVEIPGGITVQQAIDEYFMRHDFGAFPVREGDRVVGIVTLSAVRGVPAADRSRTTVGDLVVPLSETCTVSRTDPMDDVLDKLNENETRRVIVTDDGAISGIISARDLARWLERSQALGLTRPLTGSDA